MEPASSYIVVKIAAIEKFSVKKFFSYLPTQYFWVYVSPNEDFFKVGLVSSLILKVKLQLLEFTKGFKCPLSRQRCFIMFAVQCS